MSLLGIDVGTTGCKSAAYSVEGRCCASTYREYPTLYPAPGQAELDSGKVWNCFKQCIAEVASKTKTDPVSALSVSTLGEAATPVTAARCILGNSILSSDMRGSQYAERLRAAFGAEGFYDINANLPGPGYTMPKIAWTRDHLPEVYKKADKFLLWGGLVEFLLGCDPFTSFSHASRTLLFDIRKQTWSDPLVKHCDIDPSKLPQCLASGGVAGTVSDSIALERGGGCAEEGQLQWRTRHRVVHHDGEGDRPRGGHLAPAGTKPGHAGHGRAGVPEKADGLRERRKHHAETSHALYRPMGRPAP